MQTYINPQLADWADLTSRPTKEAQDLQKKLIIIKQSNIICNNTNIVTNRKIVTT